MGQEGMLTAGSEKTVSKILRQSATAQPMMQSTRQKELAKVQSGWRLPEVRMAVNLSAKE